nr:hypothetical protein [Tanacetum cinerariifolium]
MHVHIIVKDTRTIDMIIDQQVALDEALVPHASILRIGKRNVCLRSNITSKESTLQLVKRIVNLEYFREMLLICPRLPGQTFDELIFEEEILAFLRFLGYSEEIRKLTDVNINKLHQPWRSFVAVINKCLSEKSTCYDSLRNFKAYKEYYTVASGAAPPKTKASFRKTKSSFDTTITPPTVAGTRLSTSAKGKQPAKASKAKSLTVLFNVAMTEAEQIKLAMKRSLQQTHISQASGLGTDEGTGIIPGVPDVPTEDSVEEISWKLSDDDDDDDVDEKSDDQDNDDDQDTNEKTPENSDDEGNDDASLGLNVGSEEGQDTEDDEDELYRDVNINLAGRDVQMTDVHTTQEFKDTHVTLTLVNPDGQQQSSSVSSQFVTSMLNLSPDAGIDFLFEPTSQMDVPALTTVASLTLTAPTLTPPTIPTISRVPQAPTPPTTASSTLLQDLPNFGLLFRFDHRLKTFEANFSEFMQTNQFPGAVFSIPGIIQRYMDQQMNEAVKVAVQIQSDRLCDEAQAENEEFLKNLDENIQKIINENLYKDLVEAYESDKIILDTYEDTVTLKRHRDDTDGDEEPSAGLYRGSKICREGKEPESTSAPKKKARPLASLHKGPNLNKILQATTHESIQPWISDLAKQADSRSSFNELVDTTVGFLAFLMNRLKVDTLTPELLAGPTYELMKGSCKSLVELEFFLEEVYKATTDQLDWNN